MNGATENSGRFGDLDRIVLDGTTAFRFLNEAEGYYHFYEVSRPERIHAIATDAVDYLVNHPNKFRHDIGYYSLASMEKRAKRTPTMADLAPVAAADLHRKYELVMAWRDVQARTLFNDANREQAALERVYFQLQTRYLLWEVRSKLCLKKKPVTLQTLLVWDARLKAFGDAPGALLDGRTNGSGNRTRRFTPDEEELITWAINEVYLQKTSPRV